MYVVYSYIATYGCKPIGLLMATACTDTHYTNANLLYLVYSYA